MTKYVSAGVALAVMLAAAPGVAGAASYTAAAKATSGATAFTTPSRDLSKELLMQVQHNRGGPAYRGGYRGGAVYRGGGPGWGYRPWYRRPYYGTIIGGIALGTIIGVTAYGLAPPRPRPDMCWYWADELQSRGYWDYC